MSRYETPRYNRLVADAFDKAAVGYDRPAMRFFSDSAVLLARGLPLCGHEIVLDVATGTGNVAHAVAARLPRGRVIGIDLSAGMLERARARARKKGVVFFEQGDAQTPAYPDGFFDGATSGFGVHFWPEMADGVRKVMRKVRPGGFFSLSAFAKGSFEPQSSLTLRLFGDAGVRLPATYSLEKLDTEVKMRDLMRGAGLRDIRIERRRISYRLPSPDAWWDLVMFTGYRAFLDKLTPAARRRYRSALLHALRSDGDRSGRLSVEVLIGLGGKAP